MFYPSRVGLWVSHMPGERFPAHPTPSTTSRTLKKHDSHNRKGDRGPAVCQALRSQMKGIDTAQVAITPLYSRENEVPSEWIEWSTLERDVILHSNPVTWPGVVCV